MESASFIVKRGTKNIEYNGQLQILLIFFLKAQ